MPDPQPQPSTPTVGESIPVHTAHQVPMQTASISFTIEGFSGPIPPPDMLARFEQVVPGTASVIVQMAAREQEHRHHMERGMLADHQLEVAHEDRAMEHSADIAKRGQNRGLIAVLAMVALAIVLAMTGAPVSAATVAGSTMVLLVGAFAYTKWRESRETKEVAAPPASSGSDEKALATT